VVRTWGVQTVSEFSVIYGFFTYTPMSNNETLGSVCFVIHPSLSNITCVFRQTHILPRIVARNKCI